MDAADVRDRMLAMACSALDTASIAPTHALVVRVSVNDRDELVRSVEPLEDALRDALEANLDNDRDVLERELAPAIERVVVVAIFGGVSIAHAPRHPWLAPGGSA